MLILRSTLNRVAVGPARVAARLALALILPLNYLSTLSMPARAQQTVPAAVAACAAQPEICGLVVVGFGVWYVYWRGRPPEYCTFATCEVLRQPLRIDDPDQPIESQIIDYVWGNNATEAEQNCKRLAAQAGLRYVKVRRTSQKGKRWECHVDNHPETTPHRGR
ncbi:hypothetical protein H6F86_31075 [Phormidium sp. FACHB-592]|uniref:Ig-like domain-containing protein n=1 Tax=Stenomitos frigidus AS-A4 TaxID=2933935 RepID=A0ABV0KVM8_9CYAN|nr:MULTISPECIES: hypothetical protein [Cyanophyceae]MBD2034500.1 hypothetical protein [Leptolyngbya sp. FACHB-321]MBD2078254.1 hypothetical protein [Phormidium sp. FACHB-592]